MRNIKFSKSIILVFAVILFAFLIGVSRALQEKTPALESHKYEPKGKRDPFAPLVTQEKVSGTSLEDVSSVDDLQMEGIAVGAQGKRVAIMNGEMVKENDKFGNLEIKKITKNSVDITLDGKQYTLNLPIEGGAISEK